MKNPLPPKLHSCLRHKGARHLRYLLATCLAIGGFLLAAGAIKATLNHPPFVSWIPDQAVIDANPRPGFAIQYFRMQDYDANSFLKMVDSSNGTFYPKQNVHITVCTTQPDYDAGCASDGTGYKVSFDPIPGTSAPGATTITIRAKESGVGGLTGYTSFTLRLAPVVSVNPPTSQNLPNFIIQIDPTMGNIATYKTKFVVGDLGTDGKEDVCQDPPPAPCDSSLSVAATSNNPLLSVVLDPMPLDLEYIDSEIPRRYTLTATSTQTGVATVTVEVTDRNNYLTSTSFVLQVISATDKPPAISAAPLQMPYVECPIPTPAPLPVFNYVVTNDPGANLPDLKVVATSSNTKLVPNDSMHLAASTPTSGGTGTVTVTPMLPLPSPSPGPGGLPQTSTITLSVVDGAYTRQSSFLYVVRDPACPAVSFSRPSGVYPTRQPTLPERYPFLTGSMYSLQWDDVEDTMDIFNFSVLATYIDGLPPLQDLTLDLHKEPCYIAATLTCAETGGVEPCLQYEPWCDGDGANNPTHCDPEFCSEEDKIFKRAVPWDSYLEERWKAYIEAMAGNLSAAEMSKISIVNINLPGAGTGIRNVMANFSPMSMPGYSRPALLDAIEKDLRVVQNNFPGKFVQIGFFPAKDCNASCAPDECDPTCPDNQLWRWLYKDATTDPAAVDADGVQLLSLLDEFNGIKRPRVSFFQEDLSATRTSIPSAIPPVSASSAPNYVTPPGSTAYTISPLTGFIPSFDYYGDEKTNDEYNNGITFQANTIWSNPFSDDYGQKLIKTINGSPNDAMEGAFNTFLSQYLEVYVEDLDEALPLSGPLTLNAALWAGQLQSWHDYAVHLRNDITPLEAPAGLTVERSGATSNLVKWDAVMARLHISCSALI